MIHVKSKPQECNGYRNSFVVELPVRCFPAQTPWRLGNTVRWKPLPQQEARNVQAMSRGMRSRDTLQRLWARQPAHM